MYSIMIRDLSQTLRAILTQPGLPAELAAAQIAFDRPTEQFNPSQTTVDLFLFDVQENKELRSNEPTIERRNGQATVRQPPLRVMCSYLVTAWPVGGTEQALQEHRLLSQVLQVFSGYPTIPEPFLQGNLRGQEPPLPMHVSVADGLKGTAEFWTALHSPLRASLMVTVTISLTPVPAPLPETYDLVTEPLVQQIELDRFQIDGQVKNINHEPVAGATVQLIERGQTLTTQQDGYYSFRLIPSGTYTLRVQRPGAAAQDFPITVPSLSGGKYNLRLT
ncbi:MAG TPA: Pvc16 family protein [Allocoleopsis sp.]